MKIKTIKEALDRMSDPTVASGEKWEALAIALREFMLSQCVDLDYPIEE